MNSTIQPATATSLGSLPHDDPAAAVALVLETHPTLPAAPQLSSLDVAETMLGQVATVLRGVDATHGGLYVSSVDAVEFDEVAPTGAGWSGFDAFVTAIARRRQAVKIQVAGPVTVTLALVRAGLPIERATVLARQACRWLAGQMADRVRASAPGAPLVAFLDEPGLTGITQPDFPLSVNQVIDALAEGLAAFGLADTGVHCCGPTDWHVVAAAGPAVLSLPAEPLGDSTSALAAHLEQDGWVAWGAIPTHRPIGASPDPQWRALIQLWCELTQEGFDPVRLRRQSLITPACGLAGHGVSQAGLVLSLAADIASKVHSQAVAARLSVGA